MVWNKRALLMVLTASALLLVACSPLGAESTPRTRILFITSEPDHSYAVSYTHLTLPTKA